MTGVFLRKTFFRNTAYDGLESRHTKKARRRRTGQDPGPVFSVGPRLKDAIDRWRAGEPHKPSRSEAIRWLIGQGLMVELKQRPK